jgi:2-dehydropantoate 2-reductase
MRIVVVGAGAIGSLFAAKLSFTNDVTVIGRADHVAAINGSGLRIEGLESKTVHLAAATRIEELPRETLILLATKVPATTSALASFATLVRGDTTILCLQNGLGSEQIAREAVNGRALVLRGITQAGAIFERPGAIKYMVRGDTLIERHPRSKRIADVMNGADLDCRISPDIKADVWQKLIFNCVVNPITAMIGCEVGGIADPRLDRLKQLVIEECLAVAKEEGFSFQIDFMQRINEVFGKSHNIASMLQDVRRGRPSEIDYMNGAVAAVGARHNLPCPVNVALTNIIKAMSQSRNY